MNLSNFTSQVIGTGNTTGVTTANVAGVGPSNGNDLCPPGPWVLYHIVRAPTAGANATTFQLQGSVDGTNWFHVGREPGDTNTVASVASTAIQILQGACRMVISDSTAGVGVFGAVPTSLRWNVAGEAPAGAGSHTISYRIESQ